MTALLIRSKPSQEHLAVWRAARRQRSSPMANWPNWSRHDPVDRNRRAEGIRALARVVRTASGNIAVFRTDDDEAFALDDRCAQGRAAVSGHRAQQA
jgi:hypothetical protein